MSRRVYAWVLLLCLIAMGKVQAQLEAGDLPVKASLVSEVKQAVSGQAFQVAVKLVHEDGWHTYGKELPADVIGKPTNLKWTLPEGWQVEEQAWPPTHEVPSTDGKTTVGYDGTVYLPVKITPKGEVGSQHEISVEVNALACDPKSCRPVKPKASLTLGLAAEAVVDEAAGEELKAGAVGSAEVADSTKTKTAATEGSVASEVVAPAANRSFISLLWFAFLGGLILNIMPCVFPVLGVKVMSVVQQAGEEKGKVVMHGLVYTLGILVCFWILGGLVVALGKSWGFQLQSVGLVYGLTAFFLVFALNMAGVFEIGSSAVGVGADLQSKQGYLGSFFTGLLAVVVATPCTAPFLGTALTSAVSLPAVQAMLLFSMIGLGLAAPFLILCIQPKLISALPRPGAWMESFKQGMSFLLFGAVAYMLYILTGMIKDDPLLFALFGLVLVALGAWIYGRWFLPHKSVRARAIALVLATVFVAGGLAYGWPKRPDPEAIANAEVLQWQEWSPERVAELQAEGTPVYVDYTAKWCFTCQVNKRVYSESEIIKMVADKKVVLLKADWTNEDPRIADALKQLGKAAIPVNVLYLPDQKEPLVLDELDGLLTKQVVLNALAKIP